MVDQTVIDNCARADLFYHTAFTEMMTYHTLSEKQESMLISKTIDAMLKCAEKTLKGYLALKGYADKKLHKEYSHNLINLTQSVNSLYPNLIPAGFQEAMNYYGPYYLKKAYEYPEGTFGVRLDSNQLAATIEALMVKLLHYSRQQRIAA